MPIYKHINYTSGGGKDAFCLRWLYQGADSLDAIMQLFTNGTNKTHAKKYINKPKILVLMIWLCYLLYILASNDNKAYN